LSGQVNDPSMPAGAALFSPGTLHTTVPDPTVNVGFKLVQVNE